MKTSKRNGKIEFLRFLFSVIIVIHHSRYLLGDKNCMFLGGSFAVEFFFLVSGYLMMATIEGKNAKGGPGEGLGKETAGFLLRKIKAVYPEVLIGWIIAVVFVGIVKESSLIGFLELFADSFFEATLMKMSGITNSSINGVTWYISSMLLCMAVLYPLLRKFPDMMIHVGAPLAALLLLGYLCGEYGTLRTPTAWIGFTYKGNLRAFAELCLGVLCFQAAKRICTVRFSTIGRVVLTVVEWGLYGALIWFMYTQKAGVRDYFWLAVMAVAVTLSFSARGIDAQWFNKPVFYWLGRFSLPLYLAHTYYAQNLNLILPEEWTAFPRMTVYLACAVATSFAIMAIALAIKKATPAAGRLLRRVFLEDTQ